MFPQLMYENINSRLTVSRNEKHIKNRQTNENIAFVVDILSKEEKIIDDLYAAGKSVKDIESFIRNDSIYEEEQIKKNFAEQLSDLKVREEHCDIKISDYIKNNYQEIQLFYDPFHPTNEVIMEKGRRILNNIGIPVEESTPVVRRLDTVFSFKPQRLY